MNSIHTAKVITSIPGTGMVLASDIGAAFEPILINIAQNDSDTGACTRYFPIEDETITYMPCPQSTTGLTDNAYGTMISTVAQCKDTIRRPSISIATHLIVEDQGLVTNKVAYRVGADTWNAMKPKTTADKVYPKGHTIANLSYPGDSEIRDKAGATDVHVGRYIARLEGSAYAYVEACDITNTVRSVANAIEQHTVTVEDVKTSAYTVQNIAMTVNDALGGDGIADKLEAFASQQYDDITSVSTSDYNELFTTLPIYKVQTITGDMVGGIEFSINTAIDNKHTLSNPMIPLYVHHTGLSGNDVTLSANRIASIKTPYIPQIRQNIYTEAGVASAIAEKSPQLIGDLRIPDLVKLSDSDESTVQTEEDIVCPSNKKLVQLGIEDILNTVLSETFLSELISKLEQYGCSIAKPTAIQQLALQELLGDNNTIDTQACGQTQQQQYPDSTPTALGDCKKLYDNSSIISQEADGSIVISDGWGSEIRLSHGNIYISPALDLLIKPGRDLFAMTPGNQAFTAQKTTTIDTYGSMYVIAKQDMKISACSNTTKGTTWAFDVDVFNGEVTVQTDKSVCITANENIGLVRRKTIRSNDKIIYSPTERQFTEADINGAITIYSGNNGDIYQYGKHAVLTMRDNIVQSVVNGSQASSIVQSVALYDMYVNTIFTQSQIINGIFTTVPNVTYITDDGESIEQPVTVATTPYFINAGSLYNKGYCLISDSMFVVENITAYSVSSTELTGMMGWIDPETKGEKTENGKVTTYDIFNKDSYKDTFDITYDLSKFLSDITSLTYTVTGAYYSDTKSYASMVRYPASYPGISVSTFSYNRWQMFSLTKADWNTTGISWDVDNTVLDDTYAYPGKVFWEYVKTNKPYIVNVTQD